MRELSIDDLRWVAGGLPASGYEGQCVSEDGTYYVWSNGSWEVAGDDPSGAHAVDSTQVDTIAIIAANNGSGSSWDNYFVTYSAYIWSGPAFPEDEATFFANTGTPTAPSSVATDTQVKVARAGIADLQNHKTIRSAGETLTVALEFFGFSDVGMSRTERETALAQKYDPSQITETTIDGVTTGLVNDGRTVLLDEDHDGAWDIAYTTDAAGNYKAFDINGWRNVAH